MSVDAQALGEDKIGNYKYVRTLLQGQNSTVMEVVQDGSGRRFAMKQLLPSRAEDPAERRAFEFEAKLGMDLSHPNLIRVYDYVKDKHQPYFVMDFFPSEQLRLVLNKTDKYAWLKPRLHKILRQTATALAYMHDRGWVHRDIKPENIIVNKTAEARLIDYALAMKIRSGLGKLFGGKVKRQGTLSYISPEQLRCEAPAATADIYSFGITCYELACGRQPFRANTPGELLQKHMSEVPSPPTVYNKEISQEYADLVLKMIRKKAKDRPQSMQEFLSQFSRVRIFKGDPDPLAEMM